ncbi:glycoside hydrolase [Lophiotrema nucula]|uniref:Mannosyl-oligosaccharide glucosidase n=1 Tax=Lophiotrema nucula TaxID=690887 RepID=A0A6A5YRV7_9PLEO|nr:glycoside hydrolase [Lophiotrema nucula]
MLPFVIFALFAGVRSEWATDDKALRWGPYRPNLYFGVRPQAPKTMLAGLMWAAGDTQENQNNTLRDTCEYNEVDGYGWNKYDTRLGGRQTALDGWLHLDMNTNFVKTNDGESWGVRIQGVPKKDAPADVKTTFIFHVALEDMQEVSLKSLECKSDDRNTDAGRVVAACQGNDDTLGKFELKAYSDSTNKLTQGPAVLSLQVSEEKIWQAKNVWMEASASRKELIVDASDKGNLHFIQAVVQGPFSFDIVYSSATAKTPVSPRSITSMLKDIDGSFPGDVDKTFPRDSVYQDDKYGSFTQSVLSQLLGGLGFFYGDTKEDRSNATEYLETEPNFWEAAAEARKRAPVTTTKPFTLLSHTPSRPTYARGFLWDEGFHLLAVMEWDLDLAVSVIKSWMGLMDADGWIGREQILGPEARRTVPEDFQVQYPQFANPPTLLLLVTNLLSKMTKESPYSGHNSQYLASEDAGKALLEELYPLFARHAAWFRRTQAGNFSDIYPRPEGYEGQEGYRWRGATPGTCLTSGLDDYPRANPPHPGELHVDALSWVAASAAALQKVAKYLGKDSEAKSYGDNFNAAMKNLDTLHWKGDQSNAYCDTTIGEGNKYEYICHHGYVSLMPLFLGLLKPDHPKLPAVLDLISDKEHLFSDYGLRSLSAKNNNYGTGANYWRGAIWMNFNVLAVQQLWRLGQQEGSEKERAKSIATDLRDRVVKTVFDSWQKTGYIWEQYSDKTGEGSHSHPFVGWTAGVILLMSLRNGTVSTLAERTEEAVTLPLGVSVGIAASFVLFMSFVATSTVFRGSRAGKFLSKKLWGRRQHRYEEIMELREQT